MKYQIFKALKAIHITSLTKFISFLSVFLFCIVFYGHAQSRFGNQARTGLLQKENTADYTAPQEYIIGGIQVTGVKFLDPNAIISMTGLKIGDKIKIPGEIIASVIRKLWAQGILGDIAITTDKIEGDKIFLNIELKERPRLSKFTFRGIKKGEEKDLTEKISLIKGRIVTDAMIKNTQLSVKKFFNEKGFLNAKVGITQVRDSILNNNNVALKINIEKNSKTKIHKLDFQGNTAFDDKKLRKRLKDTKQKNAIRIFKPSRYIQAKYDEDKEKLIKFYNARGYRDARVVSDSIAPHDKKTIDLTIHVEEGKKYYFRNITWTGNYLYTDEKLSTILGIAKGDVYDMEKLEKRLNYSESELDVSSLYMDDGYLFFNVNPVEVSVIEDSIDIEIRVYEGQQATISKIILSGNTKTSDHVVLREIRTMPGQKFSRSDLIRSQREITQLGYFDPEKVAINPIPHPENGTVDIEYGVVEKPSDQLELSGGWGGAYGFVGTLGVVFNNFSIRKAKNWREWRPLPSGDGQRMQVRAQANGKQYQNYSLGFSEPWLGGRKPQNFSVNLSHASQSSYTGNDKTGSLKIYNASIGLGRRLKWPDDFFVLNNSIGYTLYQLNNYGAFQQYNFTTGFSNSITFNTTIARRSIDSPVFPRRGSEITLSINLTPPYSLLEKGKDYTKISSADKFKFVEYHKWMFDASWFSNLVGKLVLNTRFHMGYLGAYNRQLGAPPFERFLLGGSGLSNFNNLLGREIVGLRGYADNVILPYASKEAGTVYNKFVMELRYPVSTNPAATIFLLTFAEGGNNWSEFSEYNPFDLKRSAGAGVRIFMPAFGMLGIDYGYAFDRVIGAPDGGRKAITFTIGVQPR